MMLYSVCAVEESVQFRLPQGMEPVAMPPAEETFASPVLSSQIRTSFAGGTLARQENLQLLHTRVLPEEYALLKKQLREMDAAAIAANYTMDCIRCTAKLDNHWYGAAFEPVLGNLIDALK